MGLEYREKIIALAKEKGPLLPADVAKSLSVSSIFASAMLSEMTENKFLAISSIKIGGSPLYYLPDRIDQLEAYASKLNDKDKRVFEILKSKLVLRDSDLDLLTRYSLRQLRDFARPMHISKGAEAELYWRFYSLSEQQALDSLNPLKPKAAHLKPALAQNPAELERKPATQASSIEAALVASAPANIASAPAKKARAKKHNDPNQDALYQKLLAFCSSHGMSVKDVQIVSAHKDIECIVSAQSSSGTVDYFCKVKDKKSISDTDIAALFAQSTVRKLPALFLITGALSKKASAALNSYSSVTVQHL